MEQTRRMTSSSAPPGTEPDPSRRLPESLDRWVQRDLISRAQADAILAAELGPPPETLDRGDRGGPTVADRRPTSLVGEALGYVGSILVLVAAATIAGWFWADLGVLGRLAVTAVSAAALLAAGAVLPPRLGAPGQRLRAVSWLLGTILVAVTVGLAGDEVLALDGATTGLLAATVATVVAVLLWMRSRAFLQHGAAVTALAVTVGLATGRLPGADETVVGLALCGFGVAWILLGQGVLNRTLSAGAAREAALFGGAVAVVAVLLLTLGSGWGTALALLTAAVLVAAGIVLGELVLLIVGAVATLIVVPWVLERWFPDTLVAPVAVLVIGAVLMVIALVMARGKAGPRAPRTPPPMAAATLAAAVLLVVGAAVLALGLG